METFAEIKKAVEDLPLQQKRELFYLLSDDLAEATGIPVLPDVKAILSAMPDVGTDEDFARIREMPREIDLS